ncbi:gamma-secretase subunit pen-2 [Phlebotomus argentipes]|uniref:gamma-secretase subunit pen-2 n=1 Tax=Phlebotomus argentipes TaxID=94469 RepID=UPI00289377DC|nr:gamma-secretase subunit pen-2 [Phlebotomus argentipes]
MHLDRVTNDRKLYLCRWYFRAGFACLPFVWAINTIWFFSEAFRKPPYEEQAQIKKYVLYSALGSIVWLVVIISWVTIYQYHRAEWGEFGDRISLFIPLGKP